MPRAKSSPVKKSSFGPSSAQPARASSEADWMSFVPCELDVSQREEFTVWQADNVTAMWVELDDAIGKGWKHSLTYDAQNECYVASLSGRPSITADYDWLCTLTGRGGSMNEAIAVLVYKHVVLLRHDWYECVNTPRRSKRQFG